MTMVTSTVFSPGSGAERVYPEQIVVVPKLGLIMVGDAPGSGKTTPEADGRAGLRIAMDAVRAHFERNEDILQRFRRTPDAALRQRILAMFEEAYGRAAAEVFAFARRRKNLLVTLDTVLLSEREAFVGHIGDGRVYLVRRGLVHQLTVDHSRSQGGGEVFDLVGEDAGQGGDGGGRSFTRALGPLPQVRIESMSLEIALEDRFIVTSAHLHRSLPESILNSRITSEPLMEIGPAIIQDVGPETALAAACVQLGSGDPYSLDSAAMRLAILAPMPLFAHCSERELRSIAQATRPRQFEAGTVIFEQDQPGT